MDDPTIKAFARRWTGEGPPLTTEERALLQQAVAEDNLFALEQECDDLDDDLRWLAWHRARTIADLASNAVNALRRLAEGFEPEAEPAAALVEAEPSLRDRVLAGWRAMTGGGAA
jgi:hypothetical protein